MPVVGLDVGTTGCKACIFDRQGNLLGSGFREYPVICTEPHMGEQDADLVWELTLEVLSNAVAAAAVKPRALCVSVQGDAIIPVDRGLRPQHHAILGMDYRSDGEAREAAGILGDRVLFDRTGMRPHPINSAVKMLWLRKCRPEVFESAWKIVTYADYLTGRLSGDPVIDHTMASRTMCFDLHRRDWADDILDALGIPRRLLCPHAASGTVIGKVLPGVARATGLPEECLVVCGAHDQTCAAVGAGVIEEGRGLISTGTAEVMSVAFSAPRLNDVMYGSYYPCYMHAVPGMYFSFSLNHTGGLLFKWYRDTIAAAEVAAAGLSGRNSYDVITSSMTMGPSPVTILPHFNGSGTPTCDLQSRGAILGLSLATTRDDLAKALLESLCFELRLNLERMSEAGIRITTLAAAGGGARSDAWLQLKADILARPLVSLETPEASCLGAAVLAAAAAGIRPSVREAVKSMVRRSKTWVPDENMRRRYEEKYRHYRELHPALRGINSGLKPW